VSSSGRFNRPLPVEGIPASGGSEPSAAGGIIVATAVPARVERCHGSRPIEQLDGRVEGQLRRVHRVRRWSAKVARWRPWKGHGQYVVVCPACGLRIQADHESAIPKLYSHLTAVHGWWSGAEKPSRGRGEGDATG
jgi:hypothetical protein